ncbi:PepSY domain-containing protein [Sporosarcina sp. Te-1]|uniref:PepSY domain-containing protein n=1 Tax=Sporosarcina sp. Te-1 TaxID=2818390 RepID=UPI001A9E48B7|nr:PepSY domain-containing protein [Sporosarcina sp. Te-1]QTD40459.1 PepSY domain-containing protein [Sporosarcina sp. Te-1]
MKKWIRKPWFIPILLTVLILVVSEFYSRQIVSKAQTLSEKEIRDQLEKMYEANVVDVSENDDEYEITLARGGSEYEATVDAKTGQVLALIQTKEVAKAPPAKDQETGEPQDEDSGKENAEGNSSGAANQTGGKSETMSSGVTKPTTPGASGGSTQTPAKPTPDKKPTVQPAKPAKQPEKKSVLITEKRATQIAVAQLKTSAPYEVDDVDFVKTGDGGYYLVNIELDTDEDLDEVTYKIHAISGVVMSVTWDD